MSLSNLFPFGWLLNKKAARVEVKISLAFLHWVRITLHPLPVVSEHSWATDKCIGCCEG